VRHDADDIAYPHRLAQIAEYVERYPDAGAFYSLADYHQRGPSLGMYRSTRAEPEVLRNLTKAGYLLAICHPTITLNVTKTLSLGGYRPSLQTAEDVDLWWRMALAHDIRMIPEVTVGCRLNPGSHTNRHLFAQATEHVYVQYLLISHLWGLIPQEFESIRPALESMVDRKLITYRHRLRQSGMALGERRVLRSATWMAWALTTAPTYFAKRVSYAFSRNEEIAVNGINPLRFAARSEDLWGQATDNSGR
jgi:hypothetical protein